MNIIGLIYYFRTKKFLTFLACKPSICDTLVARETQPKGGITMLTLLLIAVVMIGAGLAVGYYHLYL